MFQGPTGYIAQICEDTCSMKTVQQNGRFTLFSISKFHTNIYSFLFDVYIFFPLLIVALWTSSVYSLKQ